MSRRNHDRIDVIRCADLIGEAGALEAEAVRDVRCGETTLRSHRDEIRSACLQPREQNPPRERSGANESDPDATAAGDRLSRAVSQWTSLRQVPIIQQNTEGPPLIRLPGQ